MPSIQSGNRISPAMIVIIVILAIVVFISGLLHLLVRFIMKQRSSSNFESGGNLDMMSGSGVFQRQLQHLFNLHDSGLDQAFIDALPVFLYKDLVGGGGLNEEEPYDCPVCLSELSEQDKLRLLPLCGHAFHIDCIDTWLLSNSTCPVCRGTLLVEGFSIDNPCFEFDDNNNSRNEEDGGGVLRNVGIDVVVVPKPSAETEKRVFSVRLGKFKNVNEEEEEGRVTDIELGETSNNLDGRRCFSLGSYRYVLADTELQVAICPDITTYKINTIDEENPPPTPNGGKKINMGSKGESFSVSKVWQWSSKKGKLGNHHNHVSDFSYPFSSGSIQSFTTR